MTDDHTFDVRISAKRRAVLRLVITFTFSVGLFIWGFHLLPENPDWNFTPATLEAWDGWGFLGLVMIGSALFGLVKETVFGIKSIGQTGHWHFMLKDSHLTWDVPDHAHGEEIGFRATLAEISSIEFRTIQQYEEMDVREYWVHFEDRCSVQLQSYSGVSVAWLVSVIHNAGAAYSETIVQR